MTRFLANAFYMPPQASTVADEVDFVFNFVVGITLFFCALVFALMLVFAVRYRHRRDSSGDTPSPGHSTALELTWTIIPTIIVLVVFFYGFRGYLNMTVVPPNTYDIQVQSRMWAWSFVYPNGHVDNELHVPKGRPIRLVLTSNDVIHSFYVPAFRIQKQNVPGRYNRTWFQATQTGEFPIYCAQYCGLNHSEMMSKVVVHEPAEFVKWLETASNPELQPDFTPLNAGKQLTTARGCMQCHSTDGSAVTGGGPSWLDLFGSERQLADGRTVIADEQYIRDSIFEPAKDVVAGYPNRMPSYLGTIRDREVDWIIAYLKDLSRHYTGDDPNAAAPATAPAAQTQESPQ